MENSARPDKMHDTLEYLASPRSDKLLSTDFTKEETPRIIRSRLVGKGENSESKSRKESMDTFLSRLKDSAPSSPTKNSSSECEICFEFTLEFNKEPLLKCGHKYCNQCYATYLEQKISFDTVDMKSYP